MLRLILAVAASCLLANGAAAQNPTRQAGDWFLRVGASIVDPKSGNLRIDGVGTIEVDSGTSLTLNGTYMVTDNVGVELLAAWPFSHDIDLEGAGQTADTKHLPPTLSVQWHFNPVGRLQPYLGLGVNWTLFFDEDVDQLLTDALGITDIDLDDSFGLAAQAGFDFNAGENWCLNFELRWIDIDTDLEAKFSDGSKVGLGEVEIDPLLYGLNVGYRF
jgi:outer membrane protein